jgi:D-3-phosphoglycerate dehydrogenase
MRDTIIIELGNGERHRFEGALLRGAPHIIRIENFWIDLELNGYILVCHNQDRPGMIGQIGTLLGREQVNISFMQVGRDHPRGTAVMAIGLDELPPERLMEEIRSVPDISSAELISVD